MRGKGESAIQARLAMRSSILSFTLPVCLCFLPGLLTPVAAQSSTAAISPYPAASLSAAVDRFAGESVVVKVALTDAGATAAE